MRLKARVSVSGAKTIRAAAYRVVYHSIKISNISDRDTHKALL